MRNCKTRLVKVGMYLINSTTGDQISLVTNEHDRQLSNVFDSEDLILQDLSNDLPKNEANVLQRVLSEQFYEYPGVIECSIYLSEKEYQTLLSHYNDGALTHTEPIGFDGNDEIVAAWYIVENGKLL